MDKASRPLLDSITQNKDSPKYQAKLASWRRYRERNLEQLRERTRLGVRQFIKEHPDRFKLIQIRYLQAHPEAQRLANQRFREKHHDERLLAERLMRITAGDVIRERDRKRARAYARKHPEANRLKHQHRQARLRNLPADLTPYQWIAIKDAHKGRCAYCAKKTKRLTQDHIIPITKGGAYTMNNILPACPSCNSRKNNRLPSKPVQLVFI